MGMADKTWSGSMKVAVAASLGAHALLLAVRFAPPPASWAPENPAVMAVLVNAKTKQPPRSAKAIAQASLDGGGAVDQKGWMPSSPLERGRDQAAPEERPVESSEDAQKLAALEGEVSRMLAQSRKASWTAASDPQESKERRREREQARRQALDLAAQIDARAQAYASRPKKVFVGLQAVQSDLAAWIEAWQRKVEGVGNAFYPEGAKGRLRGSLIMTAGMRQDGTIESVRVERSSGHKALDEAAGRIMRMSGPFEPFDAAMRKRVDIIYITRQWRFGPEGIEAVEPGA